MTAYDPIHQGRELPSFSLRQIDLPEILEWEVNGKYYLVLKVEMVGKRNRKDLEAPEDKQKIEADFQVQSIRSLGDKPVDASTLEKKEFEKVVAKARSGEFS